MGGSRSTPASKTVTLKAGIDPRLPFKHDAANVRNRIAATISILLGLAAATAGESRVVIELREFEFTPEQPTVSPGEIVVWKNLNIVPHTATSEDDSWDSGLIEAGGTWEMVVTEDLVLAYYCRFHPSMIAALDLASE